jgi:hypothetical protein
LDHLSGSFRASPGQLKRFCAGTAWLSSIDQASADFKFFLDDETIWLHLSLNDKDKFIFNFNELRS